MERICNTCLDLISRKKTYSTDINMLKRKPLNEYHQTLPWFVVSCAPRKNIIDFESAKESLLKDEAKMVAKRQFERRNKIIESKPCIKNEDIAENKEILIYGFKGIESKNLIIINWMRVE